MNQRLYVVAGFGTSVVGSFLALMLILANYKTAISNPDFVWMIFAFMAINIAISLIGFICSVGWWLEKEDSYHDYRKMRRQ